MIAEVDVATNDDSGEERVRDPDKDQVSRDSSACGWTSEN